RPGLAELRHVQVVYRGYPSIMNYPRSIGISAIVTAVGIIMWETSGFILFGGLCLAMLTYIRVAYERATRVYLVTPERIETVFGFVTKSSNEVRVRDIRAINVRTQGLKGWLGVGDVEFASAGGQEVEVLFRGVWKPHRLKQLVRAVQDSA
ncbi:MAG: PH domain-containing protein, partial [Verrucomicrobiota bacterium]